MGPATRIYTAVCSCSQVHELQIELQESLRRLESAQRHLEDVERYRSDAQEKQQEIHNLHNQLQDEKMKRYNTRRVVLYTRRLLPHN